MNPFSMFSLAVSVGIVSAVYSLGSFLAFLASKV